MRKEEVSKEQLGITEKLVVQHSKLAEMGTLFAAIAHQWMQPLNAISIMAQSILVIDEIDSLSEETKEEIENTVDSILQQIEFMSQTVQNLRNFLKPTKEKEVFDVNKSIQEILNLFKVLFEKRNIEIFFQAEKNFNVLGYINEFKQVILNILNNSKDVLVEKKDHDRKILISTDIIEHNGIIKISDNGGGIPEELLPDKLFLPFVSTKGNSGTGIGLQLSKAIIEKIHGSIAAHNKEFGAEFIISIPVYLEP